MKSIAVTKPDMGVLSRKQLPLSPFGALAQAFAEELLARAEWEEGVWPFVPLELLEEKELPLPSVPSPGVTLQVDLRLVLEALRRENTGTESRRAAERLVERVIRIREQRTAAASHGISGRKGVLPHLTGTTTSGSAFLQKVIQGKSIHIAAPSHKRQRLPGELARQTAPNFQQSQFLRKTGRNFLQETNAAGAAAHTPKREAFPTEDNIPLAKGMAAAYSDMHLLAGQGDPNRSWRPASLNEKQLALELIRRTELVRQVELGTRERKDRGLQQFLTPTSDMRLKASAFKTEKTGESNLPRTGEPGSRAASVSMPTWGEAAVAGEKILPAATFPVEMARPSLEERQHPTELAHLQKLEETQAAIPPLRRGQMAEGAVPANREYPGTFTQSKAAFEADQLEARRAFRTKAPFSAGQPVFSLENKMISPSGAAPVEKHLPLSREYLPLPGEKTFPWEMQLSLHENRTDQSAAQLRSETETPGVGLQMAESEKDKAIRRTTPVPGDKETTAIERQGLAAAFLRDKTIRSTIANDLLPITLAHSARYGEQSSLLPDLGRSPVSVQKLLTNWKPFGIFGENRGTSESAEQGEASAFPIKASFSAKQMAFSGENRLIPSAQIAPFQKQHPLSGENGLLPVRNETIPLELAVQTERKPENMQDSELRQLSKLAQNVRIAEDAFKAKETDQNILHQTGDFLTKISQAQQLLPEENTAVGEERLPASPLPDEMHRSSGGVQQPPLALAHLEETKENRSAVNPDALQALVARGIQAAAAPFGSAEDRKVPSERQGQSTGEFPVLLAKPVSPGRAGQQPAEQEMAPGMGMLLAARAGQEAGMPVLHADMYHRLWTSAAVTADIRQSGLSAGSFGKYGQRQNRELSASIRGFSGLNEQAEKHSRFLLKPSGISSAQIQKETFPGASHISAGSESSSITLPLSEIPTERRYQSRLEGAAWNPASIELTLAEQAGGAHASFSRAGASMPGPDGRSEGTNIPTPNQVAPVALTYGPAQSTTGSVTPHQPEETPQTEMEESDFVRSLPEWARSFLKKGGAAHQTMGVVRDIAVSQPQETADQIQWTAPNYHPPAAPMAYREKPREEQPRESRPARISETELQRTADRVYRILEERIRRERRRLGL